LRIRTLLALCAASLVGSAGVANAGPSACTTRDFRGVYGFHAQAWNVTDNAPLTFAGSLTADGHGKITAWKDVAATAAVPPAPPSFKLVTPVLDRHEQAQSPGSEIVYTVERDCRITISATVLGPTGDPSPLVLEGGLVSGGEEALLMNASPQSPSGSLVTMKRASPPPNRRLR
jgi:hypothetical protein